MKWKDYKENYVKECFIRRIVKQEAAKIAEPEERGN